MQVDEIIPLVFPLEYLKITKKEIQLTEDPKIMDKLIQVKNRIANLQNVYSNVYLYSNLCGNGKTMWATMIAHTWVRQTGKNAFFVKDEDLNRLANKLDSFKNADAIYTLEKLCEVPFLVIDDIGTLSLTRQNSILYHKLIDRRMISKKPTLYTSNLDENALKSQLNTKLASRIWGSSYRIEFMAPDLRRLIIEENNPFTGGGTDAY